jgi:hypothetical protein
MLTYHVDAIRLGITATIKLIRQTVPASIEADSVRLLVTVEPQDAQLLADTLNERGITWHLKGEHGI